MMSKGRLKMGTDGQRKGKMSEYEGRVVWCGVVEWPTGAAGVSHSRAKLQQAGD